MRNNFIILASLISFSFIGVSAWGQEGKSGKKNITPVVVLGEAQCTSESPKSETCPYGKDVTEQKLEATNLRPPTEKELCDENSDVLCRAAACDDGVNEKGFASGTANDGDYDPDCETSKTQLRKIEAIKAKYLSCFRDDKEFKKACEGKKESKVDNLASVDRKEKQAELNEFNSKVVNAYNSTILDLADLINKTTFDASLQNTSKHHRAYKDNPHKRRFENKDLDSYNQTKNVINDDEIQRNIGASGYTDRGVGNYTRKISRHASNYIRHQRDCIELYFEAQIACDKAKSKNGKRASKLSDELNLGLQSVQAASQVLAMTKVAASGARDFIHRAQIVCGTTLGEAQATCAKAEEILEKIEPKIRKIQEIAGRDLPESIRIKIRSLEPKLAECKQATPSACNELQAQLEKYKAMNTSNVIDPIIKLTSALMEQASKFQVTLKDYKDRVHAIDEKYAEHSTMKNSLAGLAASALASKQKLSSNMAGTTNGAKVTSMADMCSQPENAGNSICKCRTDNTAQGCPGFIGAVKNEGNINKDLSGKGLSNMAGLSYGKKTTTPGSKDLDSNLDGLGDEAKKAFMENSDKKESSPAFGTASAANLGGIGSSGGAGGNAAGADKDKMVEEPKSFGSSFMNAVGSMFRGSGGGKSYSAKDEKFTSDKYKEQIKRQIAVEQMRSEISSASGTDNWTKIRTRYKSNSTSLIDNN